ncbi:ribokinase domain protein [Klebsiella pneumoniae]|nr:ribokinase domain protein [Klebsiella pneumoniae]
MATFDAVFVGLTILDIAGRPVVAIPPRGGVAFIEQIRLNPAGTAAGLISTPRSSGSAPQRWPAWAKMKRPTLSSPAMPGWASTARLSSAPR